MTARALPPGLATRLLLTCALLLVGLAGEWRVHPDADVAWLLTVGHQVSAGATPYSSAIVEINPPLVIHLSALAVAAGASFGLDGVTAWRGVVAGLLLLSCVTALPLLTRLSGRHAPEGVALTVVVVAVMAVLPGATFGQREHLIVLWLVPYVLIAALRSVAAPVGMAPAMASGAMLALAVAVKPHYAAVVLFVEAGLRRWRAAAGPRQRRPELVVAAALAVGLLGHTLITAPRYLTDALKLALDYYPDYAAGQFPLVRLGLLLLPLAVLVVAPADARTTALGRMCALAASGCAVAYAAQGKGWDYQFLPMRSFVVLATAAGVLALASMISARLPHWPIAVPRTWTLLPWLAVVALALLAERRTAHIVAGARQETTSALVAMAADALEPDQPRVVTGLTLDLFPAFPATVLMQGAWASRYSCLWMVPAIEQRERVARVADAARDDERVALTQAVVDDFTRRRPTVALIETERSALLDAIVAEVRARGLLTDFVLRGRVGRVQMWVRRRDRATGEVASARRPKGRGARE